MSGRWTGARALVLAGVLLAAPTLHADTYPKNHDVDVLNYRFELELFDRQTRIEGLATIELALRSPVEQLRFDLVGTATADDRGPTGMTVEGVRVGLLADTLEAVEFTHQDDELRVPLPHAVSSAEQIRVEIDYAGSPRDALGIGPNKHGTWSWFSDNWPNKARHWLPTVDHPYDKATSEMIVTAPASVQAISNGLLVEETDLGDGRRRSHWRQAIPVATWLYTLGVTEFAVQHLPAWEGIPVQTWVFAPDREAGFYDFAEPTHRVLDFYSENIGPYSYEKLANVVSARTRGGMEAATAIMYDDRSVTGERSTRWRNVVIHEIAHHWFGNSITEADWDDVWLSEGFATYFTLLFVEHAYGRDEFVDGLRSSRDRIFAAYEDRPNERIIHDNLDDMSKVTTGNTYQKGAWTLHMLRSWLGDDAFWRGIREYYSTYQNRNNTTADFRRVMERVSGESLQWFFDQWLRRGGALFVEWDHHHEASRGVVVLTFRQTQPEAPFRIRVPVSLAFQADVGGVEQEAHLIWLDGREQQIELDAPTPPTEIRLDDSVQALMRAERVAFGGGAADR